MGAEQSTAGGQDEQVAQEAAAVKMQAITRGRAARTQAAAAAESKKAATGAIDMAKISALKVDGDSESSTKGGSSVRSGGSSWSARAFMSWRPAGFAFTSRSKKRGHTDPKAVYEGLAGASLRAALLQVGQLQAMLASGTNPNVRDADGDRYPIHWAAARGSIKGVQALLAAGADATVTDAEGRTAAALALEAEQPTIVNLLHYGPPKPDPRDVFEGLVGPSLFVALNQPAMVKHHLLAGKSVNTYDVDGDRTPLHWAAARGAVRAAELLLAGDADVDKRDKAGRTPLALALELNQRDVYDVIKPHCHDKPYDKI